MSKLPQQLTFGVIIGNRGFFPQLSGGRGASSRRSRCLKKMNINTVMLATRWDSFCGKISLCNNLRQYGIPLL